MKNNHFIKIGFAFVLFVTVCFASLILTSCEKPPEPEKPKGTLSLITTPENALINIVGIDKDFGTTPVKEGILPPGDYIFRLSKPNYVTAWAKVTIKAGEKTVLDVKLDPVSASIMIDSKPQGASIEFEGRTIGVTPHIIPDLPVGKYSAILKATDFDPKEISWEVENARPILKKIDLASNVGVLIVTSDPSNAAISINGEPKGNTPFDGTLEQGSHKIVITKTGYHPYEQIVTVSRDKDMKVAAQLEILPSHLMITSEPEGAMIYVNGDRHGNAPVLLKNVEPGRLYTIRAEKEEFNPAEREVTVAPGETAEVAMILDTDTGGIDFVVNPPGVTIYLDGKIVGVTQADPDRPGYSMLFQIRDIPVGTHTIEAAHVRARPTKRILVFEVEKGEILRLEEALTMWIPNAVITLKNGRMHDGRLVSPRVWTPETAEILFEPEEGIRTTYKSAEIVSVKMLSEKE